MNGNGKNRSSKMRNRATPSTALIYTYHRYHAQHLKMVI